MTQAIAADLVFDVGAHRGEDSDFYLKLGYRVVAVEANPQLARLLRERFAEAMERGRFTVIERAVSETTGLVSFFINKDMSVWGTADPDWAQRNREMGAESEEITVEAEPFDAMVRSHGVPHYLKIDVEGADMLCVNALARLERRPDYLSIESNKTSWDSLVAEFDVLEQLGYTRFKVVNQRNHRSGKYRARDGSSFVHHFDEGATGPFGGDLPGRWLTRDQAIAKYRRIFRIYRLAGDTTPLAAFLSRLPLLRRLLRLVGWYDTHAAR